jgi:hypothetical protein
MKSDGGTRAPVLVTGLEINVESELVYHLSRVLESITKTKPEDHATLGQSVG